jgi:hypothetical protein
MNEQTEENILDWISRAEMLSHTSKIEGTDALKEHLEEAQRKGYDYLENFHYFRGNFEARMLLKEAMFSGVEFLHPQNSTAFMQVKSSIANGLESMFHAMEQSDLTLVDPFNVAHLMKEVLVAACNAEDSEDEIKDMLLERVQYTLGYCDFCIKVQSNPLYNVTIQVAAQ